uniref:Sterile alpha motif domain containing 11 n=1 Tax=Hucho hucho TaxID=62062 RepID=A0A4W5KMB6_9TELE
MSHPPPLLSPQNAPHIALGPHLRPPFLGMPSALCQAPSYGFLQPAQAEMFARQQEMLRKQNLARLEMSAELLRHKELESLHRQHLHHLPEGHSLHEELSRRQNAMLVLRHTNTPLLSLNHQGPSGATTPKDTQGQSCGARAGSRKGGHGLHRDRGKENSPPRLHGQSLPFGFPYTSPYFHTGMFMDGEDSAAPPVEDIRKWSVEEVCGFVGGLAGCAEYNQVFREQAIDGETLPLLTEEHLLNIMGLKLGPALKIRSQVARRVGRIFYMTSFPLALPLALPPSALRPPDRDLLPSDTPLALPLRPLSVASSSSPPYSGPLPPCHSSPKQENANGSVSGGYEAAKAPS